MDNENVYRLWDEDISMGCDCDSGFEGPDCSMKKCKVGADPLYYDDFQNVRYANYTVQFYTQDLDAEIYGNYSLVFTDAYGEDWQTDPIDIDANCQVLQSRLESLPNDVIPAGSVRCMKTGEDLHLVGGPQDPATQDSNTGQDSSLNVVTGQHGAGTPAGETIYQATNMSIVNKFILAFPGNPGVIAPLKVNRYLDGTRPTLFTGDIDNTFGVHIYANGYHGEDTDYVNDECEGVLVGITSADVANAVSNKKYTHYLSFASDLEFERLKKCLGDADGITSNNIEVYEWDWGSFMNPHLIKLIDATQDKFVEYLRSDGSSYKVLASGISTAAGGGAQWEDFPLTMLCNNQGDWQQDNYIGSPVNKLWDPAFTGYTAAVQTGGNRGTFGWCKAIDPPGFFAIIYYDDCQTDGVSQKTGFQAAATVSDDTTATTISCGLGKKGFRVMTRPATDYSTTTKFHVYTTKGTMQQVSQNSAAYTTSFTEKYKPTFSTVRTISTGQNEALNPDFVHSFHGNVIHLQNTTALGGVGAIDCETAPAGSQGQLDCLRKGDKIFLVNLGDRDDTNCEADGTVANIAGVTTSNTNKDSCFYEADETSFNSNPLYPNMYTVKKIGKIPKSGHDAERQAQMMTHVPAEVFAYHSNAVNSEGYRHQITLDMGVNALYLGRHYGETAAAADPDTKATIYKFYPPTLATTGTTGYTYVAPCSNRGTCNSDSGTCACFDGYTGDNCGNVNSLAM